MSETMLVNGKQVEKWHMKELPVEEGDRVRFSYVPRPRRDPVEKEGVVEYAPKDTIILVDVDNAGRWYLRHGAIMIIQQGRSNRHNGTLIDFEKVD